MPELYEKDGMIELSMADARGGIVTGSALMNERPIYVIRYQGFNWYNAPMIVNYAAKVKNFGILLVQYLLEVLAWKEE